MAESLKSFASFNDRNEVRITIEKQTFPVSVHLDGETCWERCHPTFISKKRKVILTCPRKVGHSSIRFYLNAQNEMFNDDWVWVEDQNRDPKTWLTDEEYLKFVTDMWQPNKRVVMHSYENLPKHLKSVVTFCKSEAYLTTFNGRICGKLKNVPNVCPDFVYSDGPSFLSIMGTIDGICMNHMDRTIITSDLLQMESLYLPRTLIVFDGQTNNARFHKLNFQRKWEYIHYKNEDISTFELIEEPLGPYNRNQLEFQKLI